MGNTLQTRAFAVNATYNAEDKSVDVVAATEQPTTVWDWDRGFVNEILLMNKAILPKSRQMPLLNAHSRWDAGDVIGSARQLKVVENELTAKVFFSEADEKSIQIAKKVEEKHITDFSIGYIVNKAEYVDAGQSKEINGKQYKGPVKVVTGWEVKELSVVPIGADKNAKARNQIMNDELRKMLEEKGLPNEATEEEAVEFFPFNRTIVELKLVRV
jgi:hypothetical protein